MVKRARGSVRPGQRRPIDRRPATAATPGTPGAPKPGGLSETEISELWDCLYLRKEEVPELLAHVKGAGGPPWLHPLAALTLPSKSPLTPRVVA